MFTECSCSGKITIRESNVEQLYCVVDLFQLTDLREMCVDVLEKSLDHNNCIDRLRFSEQQEIERLYKAAMRVSKGRFKEVVEEEAYRLMPFEKVRPHRRYVVFDRTVFLTS